jgi:hypothetical protein
MSTLALRTAARSTSGLLAVAATYQETPVLLLFFCLSAVMLATGMTAAKWEDICVFAGMEAWAQSAQLLACNRLQVGSRLFRRWNAEEITQIFASAEIGRSFYIAASLCLPCGAFRVANAFRLVLWAFLFHVFLLPAHWHHRETMNVFFALRSKLRWLV